MRREVVTGEFVLVGEEAVVAVHAPVDVDYQIPFLHRAPPSVTGPCHFSIWMRHELLAMPVEVGVMYRLGVRMFTHPEMSGECPGSPSGRQTPLGPEGW